MMKIAVIACVASASAVAAAQGILMLAASPAPAAHAAEPVIAAQVTLRPAAHATSAPAQIRKSADGHFWAEAMIDGRAVRVLVDTGATAVALTREDALRLGYTPTRLTYDYKVMTAAGEARAARVMLNTVAVAGARVDRVEAYVIENGLDTSLLGMSYLGRLRGYEASRDAMVLRP